MKRSPPTSSSCSSSSSSSCAVAGPCDPNHHQQDKKPRSKRSRKSQINNANSPNSATCSRRSSIYRGVTRHRWTGRFEAHLWDKSSWNSIQNKKGRQVYLGAYDSEEAAARTYDLAALKYWGPSTILNFSIDDYKKELQEMQSLSKEEYLASLRRRSSGFSRGVSKYRGVARHHHNGRWEARIGRVLGNKYLYLGTYNTQEEAAAAYDMAAIQYRGANAVTNFDISNYIDRLMKKGIHIDLPKLQSHQGPPDSAVVDPLKTEAEAEEDETVKVPAEVVKTKAEAAGAEGGVEPEERASAELSHGIGRLYPEFSPCMESSTIIDHVDDQDHPWNFCMDVDATTYPSLHVSDLPPFNELSDVLGDCKGFDDNIHLIFEAGSDRDIIIDESVSRESMLDNNTSSETDPLNVSVLDNLDLERGSRQGGMSPSSTGSSSPVSSSTTNNNNLTYGD